METINVLEIEDISKCSCGAVTIYMAYGESYSMSEEKASELLDEFETTLQNSYNCNHCVNRWGIDLCGCGSGEPVGECTEDFHECLNNIPSQILGEIKDRTPKF